ncbi:MAG TPA: lipase [Candidatus Thermoplasmatota archaeon]|nr:lipase [Candidatus Thermoplasmatota archaeon]
MGEARTAKKAAKATARGSAKAAKATARGTAKAAKATARVAKAVQRGKQRQVRARAKGSGLQGTGRPVLLVHGILGQRHLYWNLFRRRLEHEGFSVAEVSLPYSLLGDIRIAAQHLSAMVDAVSPAPGKVDLVCHSAGGIVARYYLKFLGGAQRVGHIVFLGSPHQGTYFSYVLPVLRIAAQVRPGAEFLRELGEDVPEGVQATNFWSPVDGVIIPAENSILRHPGARNVRVPWMHHWGFLLSPTIHRQVATALRGHK